MAIDTETQEFFTQQAADAGIPTTQTELETEFQTEADDAGLTFNNNSTYSPFWRFLRAIATTPVLSLLQWVITEITPNLFLKYASDTWLDLIGWGRNIERKDASTLTGEITFNRTTTGTTLPIPTGTWIKTPAINGTVYRVKTTAAGQFGSTDTTITVPVEAENTGVAYNLAAGYFTVLDPPITGVTSVTNASDWITTPGADDESDDDYRERIRARFPAVSDWHVNAVYKSIIAEQVGIEYSRIFIDHTQAPRGPGSADALVLFDAGVASDDYLSQVNEHIRTDGNHGHGDDLLVKLFPETLHDITATMYAASGTSAADMAAAQAEAEQIIRCAFRENSAYSVTQVTFNSRFSLANLAAEIRVLVPVLSNVEFNVWSIVSAADIPRLQTLTTTIQEV
ncbi:baseplate J/gp47 family protein [Oceanobacter sp. 4_MG-2023]|uniref:baseplate J/gp47 family protein n=1 Tax=Oceanobacter sp. 4_MG-2023 TaxID=3062623 RepID=UPI002733F32B|nr:baseplate J/gp47 family protein [Oceanobacter sp. 4_MG-2023]MDP2548904.1 baseplate J/gp47 family protein [Oceanobacter sp. 4_MG-2023]